jgi:hypothetical protein
MANICFTFEIDGRPAYMAFTSENDARERLAKGFDVVEHGRSVLRSSSVISIRPSTRDEIDAFIRLAAETCWTGRIEWQDAMDGYPMFLISGANPDLPYEDINTGLPLGSALTSGPEAVGREPRPFPIDIDDLSKLYCGAPLQAARQAA